MNNQDYKGVDDTVSNIILLIKKHSDDNALEFFDDKPLGDIFDFIAKDVRYLADPMDVKFLSGGNIELLRSPVQTMYQLAGDCDDKTILAGSLFHRAGLPLRIAVSSNRKDKKFHHVYPEVKLRNKWKTFDATYDDNKIFEEKPWTRKRLYYPVGSKLIKQEFVR